MATPIPPSLDVSTPEKMATFLRKNRTAQPNANKSAYEIQANDIVYLDGHACIMSDPPKISHIEGISGAGFESPGDEKVTLCCGRSIIDGKEYDQLFSLGSMVDCFVDAHSEREWLVESWEGAELRLQVPENPADTFVMQIPPSRRDLYYWMFAYNRPGRVYFKIYSLLGLHAITSARDDHGVTS